MMLSAICFCCRCYTRKRKKHVFFGTHCRTILRSIVWPATPVKKCCHDNRAQLTRSRTRTPISGRLFLRAISFLALQVVVGSLHSIPTITALDFIMLSIKACRLRRIRRKSIGWKWRTTQYKKLSCRRETARCLMSLNISLSHSLSLEVIRNDTLE